MKAWQKAVVGLVSLTFARSAIADYPKPLMADFMGINGHTVQFKSDLYAPLCRLVRDYHPYLWDVSDHIGGPTHFPTGMNLPWKDQSGKFRDWTGPVDWQQIYSTWEKDGFEIDASLQIDAVAVKKWPDMSKNLFDYGKAFAEYCGPSHHALVTSAEIGNEPAGHKQYSVEQYKQALEALSKGLRAGDSKLKIVTCAVQAGKPDGYCEPIEVLQGESKNYDVINFHEYAFLAKWPTYERTYPENPKLDYLGHLQKSIDWRNQNAPGKPVWITEFGYDSSTKPADAKNPQWKGVTDQQQAQWIVRSFLTMADLDLARAYLYFFDDHDEPSVHASSGVTRFLEPKPSYYAMKHLYASLGQYRLTQTVKKNDDVYAFTFTRDKKPGDQVTVAWLPTGSDQEAEKEIKLPGKVIKAEQMPLTADAPATVEVTRSTDGTAKVKLTESPLYIWTTK